VGDNLKVIAVGTTGSGRYLIGDLVGADTVINEITAQATAAVHIDPEVDTIFEIGGQDSKYISLKNGVVIDFEMNKICAAGTGSFLEEQAERFNIKIEDFGDIALKSKSPLNLGERCTVFMETNVYAHYQKGAKIEDILAGLAYSIVINYLNRVVGRKKIGNRIFFQGAVAFNKSVVAAFENILGKPIIVPQNHEVTGAIGAAIVALKESKLRSNFKGFKEIAEISYNQSTFECQGCSNLCEIKKVSVGNSKTLFYGGRCEKYEKKSIKEKNISDLIEERNNLLFNISDKKIEGEKRIGIPLTLLNYEFYPFWYRFFTELGFSIITSDPTNRKIINNGLLYSVAETCFPIKVAIGHILNLFEKKVDYIFLPVIRDMPCNIKKISGERRGSYVCPYVQAIPFIVKSSLNINSDIILDPVINFSYIEYAKHYQLRVLGEKLGKSGEQVYKAIEKAFFEYKKFKYLIRQKGENLLKNIPKDSIALVLIGRPYNTCDKMVSMDISTKLRNLGFLVLPIDYLPIEKIDIFDKWQNLYWEFGYRIMRALKIINENERLYPVYITNFGCGPDSFLLQYFEREIKKPFLKIEIDEHTADAGVITRCEAFADSLYNFRKFKKKDFLIEKKIDIHKDVSFNRRTKRKIFIPYMGDASYIGKSAFLSLGIDADVMHADYETLQLGRKYTLGKECYPFIITTGDMLKVLKYNDPEKTAFFMPLTYGPCRFGQYNRMHRIILKELGFNNIPIISPGAPESINFARECGLTGLGGWRFFLTVLSGIIAVDYLGKMLRQIRPYELNKGETEKVYQKYLNKLCQIIENSGIKPLKYLNDEIFKLLYSAKEEMIKIDQIKEKKPIIGIVGEIYIRNHPFSNNEIIKKIESLGGEVLLPPFIEWAYHTNATTKLDLFMKQKEYIRKFFGSSSENYENKFKILKNLSENTFLLLGNWFFKIYLDRLHYQIRKIFDDVLYEKEPVDIYPIWEKAERYILKWFGEAALSVGKAIDWKKQGIDGIVNVLPFTCLPGNIVTSISKKIKSEHSIPWINIAYDGLEQFTTELRLEAFFYQVKQYYFKKRG
ncbi:MAG: acyl-CoA dehydratase activase-related protein, partial [Candidatus Omnitrophica bacterium]|nr:acyl-CoA dehydratase activase-related protein [Candidatus Omnitrophota bacterium]